MAKAQGIVRHQGPRDLDKEIAASTEAIRAHPADAAPYRDRGHAWLEKGDSHKAIVDFAAAIRLDPKDSEAHRLRALAWIKNKNPERAFADLDDAIRLNPSDATALIDRGHLRKQRLEYDKATADYTTAIQVDPNSASAYYELAWLYATCSNGNFRDAKKALLNAELACKLTNMSEPAPLTALAAAHAESGNFDKALRIQWLADTKYTAAEKRKWGHLSSLYESGRPYHEEGKKSRPD
jgi:Flp pilus assembly protein TadD